GVTEALCLDEIPNALRRDPFVARDAGAQRVETREELRPRLDRARRLRRCLTIVALVVPHAPATDAHVAVMAPDAVLARQVEASSGVEALRGAPGRTERADGVHSRRGRERTIGARGRDDLSR